MTMWQYVYVVISGSHRPWLISCLFSLTERYTSVLPILVASRKGIICQLSTDHLFDAAGTSITRTRNYIDNAPCVCWRLAQSRAFFGMGMVATRTHIVWPKTKHNKHIILGAWKPNCVDRFTSCAIPRPLITTNWLDSTHIPPSTECYRIIMQ